MPAFRKPLRLLSGSDEAGKSSSLIANVRRLVISSASYGTSLSSSITLAARDFTNGNAFRGAIEYDTGDAASWHWFKNGELRIGRASGGTDYKVIEHTDDGALTLRSNVRVTGRLSLDMTPADFDLVGEVRMWAAAATAVPNNWLLCDGSTFSSTTYPRLAVQLGNKYGPVSGNTYYLPDLRSRLPIGAGTFGALAANEGLAEASRTLQHDHTHTLATDSAGAHTHGVSGTTSSVSHAGRANSPTSGSQNVVGTLNGAQSGSHNHTLSTTSDSSGAHTHPLSGAIGMTPKTGVDAMPFLGLNFIIRAL